MTTLRLPSLAASAAAALLISTGASAQTTAVFNLSAGTFANAYTVNITGPSTLIGDTNSLGVTWFGVLLQSPSVPYTGLDVNPDDGFSFTGLSAGTYALTFLGSGTGGYGGYYTVSSAVPEPESVALVLAGLAVVGASARARRR